MQPVGQGVGGALVGQGDGDGAGRVREVIGNVDDEPMCRLTTVSVSSQAAKKRVPVVGEDARQLQPRPGSRRRRRRNEPLAAQRRTSAAASSGSHSGISVSGISRPVTGAAAPLVDHPVVVGLHAGQGEVPVAVLEERLAAEPRERREARRASVWFSSMSARRAPGRSSPGGHRRRSAGPSAARGSPGPSRRRRSQACSAASYPSNRQMSAHPPSSVATHPPRAPGSKRPFVRSSRGAALRNRSGRKRCHRSGGSSTWSSTEMIRGMSMPCPLRKVS